MARPSFAHHLLLASTVAFLATSLWVAFTAPARVPGHFNAAGGVTRWDSKWTLLAAVGALALGLAAAFASALWWVGRIPPGLFNIPNRDYWLAPEHRDELNRRLAADLALIGATVMLLFSWMLITIAYAARVGGDVPVAMLLGPTVAFVIAVFALLGWIAGFRYRVPRT